MAAVGDAPGFTRRWAATPDAIVSPSAKIGLIASHWSWTSRSPQDFDCEITSDTVVAVHPTLVDHHVLRHDGREVRAGQIRPNAIQITPSGLLAEGCASAGTFDFYHLTLPSSVLARIAVDMNLRQMPEIIDPRYERTDPFLVHVARHLMEAVSSGSDLDRLYADDLAQCLVAHLFRHYSSEPCQTLPSGGLPGWRLQRVIDLIESQLPGPVDLENLALAAGLSVSHFRAAIRRTTGQNPSTFVLARRIERAKAALAASDRSIAEVALDCGFADQQHFTKRFRSMTGETPKTFRNRAGA